MKTTCILLIIILLIPFVNGCGALRSLTTKHFDFDYTVSNPAVFDSPTGTPDGEALVTSTYATIADDLVNKFDKYHGGIDWAGLKYNAQLQRGDEVRLKLMASLNAPIGSGMNIELPDNAALISDITLTSADNTIIKDETTIGNRNEALRTFLEDTLDNSNGMFKVYIYFIVTSPTGGRLVVKDISISGRAHGSLF